MAKEEEKILSPQTILEIKEQIEYYLSDANLEKDYFFHDIISSNQDGYLDLKYILKCNKIKNKGWTKEDLKKGIILSNSIELDKTGEKVRRKDNLELPELLFLEKKRKKPNKPKKEEQKTSKKGENDDKSDKKEKKERKDPLILKITCKEKSSSSWKQIFEEFKKLNKELDVIYGRFKETEGHIGVILKNNQKVETATITNKFKLDNIEFTVEKCENEDLINFWKEHGSHYEYCVGLRERHEKTKEEKSKKKKKYFEKPVKLGKKEFKDIDAVKSQTKKILKNYNDNVKLEGEDKEFVLDLLKYHHNYDEKTKDMDYIIVAPNNDHKYSRCFYIVDKNKNKIDFSSKKCIENLLEKVNSD